MERRLRFDDRNTGLVTRTLDSSHEPTVETARQPLFKIRNFHRGSIGTEDDLPTRLIQHVEGVKELFLAPIMLGQEVNIVDYQHIRGSEVMPEILHPPRLHTLMEEIHKRGT